MLFSLPKHYVRQKTGCNVTVIGGLLWSQLQKFTVCLFLHVKKVAYLCTRIWFRAATAAGLKGNTGENPGQSRCGNSDGGNKSPPFGQQATGVRRSRWEGVERGRADESEDLPRALCIFLSRMRKHTMLLSLLMAIGAWAQSGRTEPDSLAYMLDEVAVSARQAPKEVTSTVPTRIYDKELMLRNGVADVSDALHRMPGVNLRDYGGAGGLKTVSVRGFGAGHTGVNFDGVPLSDVQSGQIDLSRYSVDNVDAVSLVIGDGDDIFVPARITASAATVSIESMPLIDRREVKAKMRVGSFGLLNPFLRIGMPVGGKGAIGLVGEFIHAGNAYPFELKNGTITTTEYRNNSRMNSGHGELNFLWHSASRTTVTAKAYHYNNSRQLPGPVIYYNNVNHEHLQEQNTMMQACLKHRLNGRLALNAIAKWSHSSYFYHDRAGKYPGGVLDQRYWQREYYASAALLYSLSKECLIDYSADIFHNNLNSNLSTLGHPWRNSLLQSLTAKYMTKHLTLTARLLASLYHNGGEAKDAHRLSPSLSLSYKPVKSQQLFLRASYKNIFRMPTFNEAYFDHLGSRNLMPESTDQINVGATYTIRQSAFTLDAYVNNIRDMIVAVPYNMFVWSMTNLGRARTIGLDATARTALSISPRQRLTLQGSYSLQRAMPRTSRESAEWMKQVAYIPRHSGNISLSYENPWANLSLHATSVGERFTTNTNVPATRIEAYTEAGATVWRTFTLCRHTIDLRADAQNIFDTQYCIVARYPMPGRQMKLTVTYKL